ncbi:hypothetical protein Acr_07g0014920 [Actinidia rufa]|uniref:Uncharacterized protein n=1 Tax=Actinidia rufa TaxID=165716 RepID=A0A7J0EYM6_9ERIC|nr:hypothetical protein Acr_07g0014920 [Actinidia rufa]
MARGVATGRPKSGNYAIVEVYARDDATREARVDDRLESLEDRFQRLEGKMAALIKRFDAQEVGNRHRHGQPNHRPIEEEEGTEAEQQQVPEQQQVLITNLSAVQRRLLPLKEIVPKPKASEGTNLFLRAQFEEEVTDKDVLCSDYQEGHRSRATTGA